MPWRSLPALPDKVTALAFKAGLLGAMSEMARLLQQLI